MKNLYGDLPDLTGASCTGMDTDLFYDDYIVAGDERGQWTYSDGYVSNLTTAPKQHAYLRRVCLSCPVVQECREYAISHELYGFWGGMTAMERIAEREMRGIKLAHE